MVCTVIFMSNPTVVLCWVGVLTTTQTTIAIMIVHLKGKKKKNAQNNLEPSLYRIEICFWNYRATRLHLLHYFLPQYSRVHPTSHLHITIPYTHCQPTIIHRPIDQPLYQHYPNILHTTTCHLPSYSYLLPFLLYSNM